MARSCLQTELITGFLGVDDYNSSYVLFKTRRNQQELKSRLLEIIL